MFAAGTAPLEIQPSAMALAMFPKPMKPIFVVSKFTKAPLTHLAFAMIVCRYLTATLPAHASR